MQNQRMRKLLTLWWSTHRETKKQKRFSMIIDNIFHVFQPYCRLGYWFARRTIWKTLIFCSLFLTCMIIHALLHHKFFKIFRKRSHILFFIYILSWIFPGMCIHLKKYNIKSLLFKIKNTKLFQLQLHRVKTASIKSNFPI